MCRQRGRSFEQLTGRPLENTFGWWLAPPFGGVLVGFLLVGTLLSGLYPALVLSGFRPLSVLKGKLYRTGRSESVSLRQSLIVFQFVVSMVLIAGTLGAYRQLNYMREQSLGFSPDQLLIVKAPTVRDSTFLSRSEALKNELLQDVAVEQMTVTSEIPGKEIKAPTDFRRASAASNELNATYIVGVDEDFLSTYDMQLVAGRFFSRDRPADRRRVVLNEQAVALLGYASPEAALGERVYVWRGQDFEGEIVGVLANHHQRSLNNDYDPILLFYDDFVRRNYYALKVQTGNLDETLKRVTAAYTDFFPGNPIDYFFLDEFFNRQYQADQRLSRVFTLFAGLAIVIACLGLFGLATYTTQHRTKEIGIRKVLGATVASIVALLSRDFLKLVLVSAALAIPVAYWAVGRWLSNYAFRTEIHWWLLAIPPMVVLAIALLTVSFQTTRAALANPVDSLRDE